MQTRRKGVYHYTGFAGKLLRRAPFQDASQRVYWAPDQALVNPSHTGGTTGDGYWAPDDWPKVGAPILLPRVCRWHYYGDVAPFNAWKTTGTTVKGHLETSYPHNFGVDVVEPGQDVLQHVAPHPIDVTAGKWLGTDAYLLVFYDAPLYSGYHALTSGSTTTALYTTHKTRLLTAYPTWARYKLIVYSVDWRPRLIAAGFPAGLANTIFNADKDFWSSTVAGDLGSSGYTWGGAVADADVGGTPSVYEAQITSYFPLT